MYKQQYLTGMVPDIFFLFVVFQVRCFGCATMVQGRFASTYRKLANTKQPKERPTTTSDGHVVATLEPCFDGASYVAGDHLTFPPVYILYILHIYTRGIHRYKNFWQTGHSIHILISRALMTLRNIN